MSINRVEMSGNLTRDPELRVTRGGTPVLTFCVAVNERVRQEDGSWADRPNFIDCAMFGVRAQSLQRYLHRGSKVFVEGRLCWSLWEKDDERRSKVEVIVEDVELASRPQGQQPAETQAQATTPAARAAAAVTVHEPTTEAMDLYGEEATW